MPDRAAAWKLLTEWTLTETLQKHALCVEACMRWYARYFKEDEELWGNTGLLHDFDYEQNPNPKDHPQVGMEYLEKNGWSTELIRAIGGHAPYLGISRDSLMEKTLFAVDELSGLIMAVAYTRPNKTLGEVEVRSVMKKMKDKGFAKGVSRDDVHQGAEELGIPLEEHMAHCLTALQEQAEQLGM